MFLLIRRFCSMNRSKQNFVPDSPPKIDPCKIEQFQQILNKIDKLLVLTGAGISTESGIPDYRSKLKGRYEKHRPITHQEFMNSDWWRRRYWARNFLAWPRFSSAKFNETHKTLAKWEKIAPERFLWLITQNVDGLHGSAGSQKMTELHGCGHFVRCMKCGNKYEREIVQSWIVDLNGNWGQNEELGEMRPDGDIEVPEEALHSFIVPNCPICGPGSILKTDVVFFGDCVPQGVVEHCYEMVNECNGILILGSSLTVMSGLRFVTQAYCRDLSILIVNIGETRADLMAAQKIEAKCSTVMEKLQWK